MQITAFPQVKISSLFLPTIPKGRDYLPAGECIPFFNGRGALFHGLQLLQLRPGDTVLAPAYHCGVEIETFARSGLRILFYDVSENMDIPDDFKLLLKNEDVKAVFVIHYWGFPQKMDEISAICNHRKIPLIEDCAHALFSRFHNAPLGVHGKICICSLQKTIAVPDGGLLLHRTDNTLRAPSQLPSPHLLSLKATLRSALTAIQNDTKHPLSRIFNLFPRKKRRAKLDRLRAFCTAPPTENYRNQCYDQRISIWAQRLFKSERPDDIVTKRRSNYMVLMRLLAPAGIKPIFPSLNKEICPLFFPIYVENRNDLEVFLLEHGVESFVFGRTPHPSLSPKKFPMSQKFSRHVLGLPIHQDLDEAHIAFIASAVKQWLAEQKNKNQL